MVEVDGEVVRKPATRPKPSADLRVRDELEGYVGRAAGKLAGALAELPGFDVRGKRVLDAGASTGGFSQVLLERGAAAVFAVDVGRGQLADSVAADPRVRPMPATDVRGLSIGDLGGAVEVVVADLSFISLTLVVPTLARLLSPAGDALLLVKPQFEAGRRALDSRGVVRDWRIRAEAVADVAAAALAVGLRCLRVVPSHVPGSAGNAAGHPDEAGGGARWPSAVTVTWRWSPIRYVRGRLGLPMRSPGCWPSPESVQWFRQSSPPSSIRKSQTPGTSRICSTARNWWWFLAVTGRSCGVLSWPVIGRYRYWG